MPIDSQSGSYTLLCEWLLNSLNSASLQLSRIYFRGHSGKCFRNYIRTSLERALYRKLQVTSLARLASRTHYSVQVQKSEENLGASHRKS
jgi:hypothetical protein